LRRAVDRIADPRKPEDGVRVRDANRSDHKCWAYTRNPPLCFQIPYGQQPFSDCTNSIAKTHRLSMLGLQHSRLQQRQHSQCASSAPILSWCPFSYFFAPPDAFHSLAALACCMSPSLLGLLASARRLQVKMPSRSRPTVCPSKFCGCRSNADASPKRVRNIRM
jgi:hypothetical protein